MALIINNLLNKKKPMSGLHWGFCGNCLASMSQHLILLTLFTLCTLEVCHYLPFILNPPPPPPFTTTFHQLGHHPYHPIASSTNPWPTVTCYTQNVITCVLLGSFHKNRSKLLSVLLSNYYIYSSRSIRQLSVMFQPLNLSTFPSN